MSSKRRIRRNQCGRKVRHADEAAATLRDALDYAPTNTETHRLLAEAEAAAGG